MNTFDSLAFLNYFSLLEGLFALDFLQLAYVGGHFRKDLQQMLLMPILLMNTY